MLKMSSNLSKYHTVKYSKSHGKFKKLSNIFLGGFNPYDTALKDKSIHLTMAVLSGRHLYPSIKKGSISNTFVKIEVFGCPIDCSYGVTKTCNQNAFNPTWDEKFNLGIIHVPALSVVRVSVYDFKPKSRKTELLCQATLPVDYLRSGYRYRKVWSVYYFVDLMSIWSISQNFSISSIYPIFSDFAKLFQLLNF